MHERAPMKSTHMCMHIHTHRERSPARTSALTHPQTDTLAHTQTHRNLPLQEQTEILYTQVRPHRHSQLWDKCYTYKTTYSIAVYLQLPIRYACQQRRVNCTRLTFKKQFTNPRGPTDVLYLFYRPANTLKNKVPFQM